MSRRQLETQVLSEFSWVGSIPTQQLRDVCSLADVLDAQVRRKIVQRVSALFFLSPLLYIIYIFRHLRKEDPES